MKFDYDVIVVGGGHAGCEASLAAARLGCDTLLITSDMNRIAQMSCNPAVGGIAKGQIVREIDALGGEMGIVADLTAVQFRMLNRSKGPAVWSPRVQSDRTKYIDTWRKTLENQQNLYQFQDTVERLVVEKDDEGRNILKGVVTSLGIEFRSKAVVLTAGTFLNGLMHFGSVKIEGGRISENVSRGLSDQLASLGIETGRMKTGTPARIDGRTVDYSKVEVQKGDDIYEYSEDDESGESRGKLVRDFHKFSYLSEVKRVLTPRDCYIVHTNPDVHKILNDNLEDSPLYNGDIQSIGPRYCPSIETKIVTFADKDSHQLFLEPEGETTEEFYINGFSSSLPWNVQMDALQRVDALRDVQFYRPGYAIEYDYFNPVQLSHTLESKVVDSLFLAGQVNGTTGYEEAAAQGLIAGINAARKIKGEGEFVLGRDQAYIGVLIDDLVTKGVDEPYRMFTSRAEFRILLRQDDADMRLTPLGYDIGLADENRYRQMQSKREERDALIEWSKTHLVKSTDDVNEAFEKLGTSRLGASQKVYDLLKRPQLSFEILADILPFIRRRLDKIEAARREEIIEAAEILIKYGGYIDRERELAEKASRLENVKLPRGIDYSEIKALSTESRQKLELHRPATIGQASRIPGVSPADISVLLVMLGR